MRITSNTLLPGEVTTPHTPPPLDLSTAPNQATGSLPSPHGTLTQHPTASRLIAMGQFVNPADRSKIDKTTREFALAQTIAARKLLYYPGKVVCTEIKKAALKFQEILNAMTSEEMDLFLSMNFETNELLPEQSPEVIHKILTRLTDIESATATDRAAFVSILGFLGKMYMRTLKKRLKGADTPEKSSQFLKIFSEKLKQVGLPDLTDDVVDQIVNIGDSTSLAPRKRQEQPKGNQKELALPPLRSGVHDLGDEADATLGIAPQKRLPKVSWPVAKINTQRVFDTLEPFVDHISGRPANALMLLDLLCGEKLEDVYLGLFLKQSPTMPMESLTASQQQEKYARSALTNAVWMGVGYHSALEVIDGTLIYSGQNLRTELSPSTDAGYLLGGGAATELMIELLEKQTRSVIE